MTKYNNYHVVKVGKISKKKLAKAAKGGSVNISADELKGDQSMVLHPENAKKVVAAQKANKGVRLTIAPGEIQNDLERASQGLEGGSLWDDLKSGFNKYVKPVLSTVGDVVANSLSFTNPELAPVIQGVREGVRGLTGVGVSGRKLVKGSQEAKDHMNTLRSIRQSKARGGSFRL